MKRSSVCKLFHDQTTEGRFNWTALSVTCQRAFAGTDEHKYIQLAEDAMAKSKMMNGHA